jgi:hypothetical protein
MKKLILLFSILMVLVSLTACGPKKTDDSDVQREPSQILSFDVGTDFYTAPRTKVVVWNLEPAAVYTKNLVYRATRMGSFSLSEKSYGAVSNCTSQGVDSDYTAKFNYKLKDGRTNQFNLSPVSNYHDQITSIPMYPGDELMVTVYVTGQSRCSMLEIYLSAIFN